MPLRTGTWERAGRWLVRVLRGIDYPFARRSGTLGDLRSTGINDLGDAENAAPCRQRTPLHCRISRFVNSSASRYSRSVASATNGICAKVRADAPRHVKIIPGLTHLALPRHPAVYAQ
ncbi:MAG TPA: hypothetical protein VM580_06625, partial [Labilithrix sp.]|nr:hypothetical protein [Labilithrix sp.]